MTIDFETRQPAAETYDHYRALSTAAVAGLIVGLLSVFALLDWTLIAIPAVGLLLSALAWAKVRRNRSELTGEKVAQAGFGLSLLFLIAAPAWLTYDFVTELPPGYERISYAELQPDERTAGQLVPPSALALEGKKVFIKGFVFPGRQKDGIKEFLLVRDQGECCFGGNPKITDRIQVSLENPLLLTYEPRLHKVGGTFHVEVSPKTIDGAKGGIYYHLRADHLQ
jgi:hypothetical protein